MEGRTYEDKRSAHQGSLTSECPLVTDYRKQIGPACCSDLTKSDLT